MNRVVFKYAIPRPDQEARSTVTLPRGAQLLDVAMDGDVLVVWAMIDPTSPDFELREFLLLNTGSPVEIVERVWRYLGTVIHRPSTVHFDPVVWHVFSKGASR